MTALDAVTRFTLHVRSCPNRDCSRHHLPRRPEAESLLALPHHEFGLDVLALVGRLRHAEHRSVPEIHQELTRRGAAIAPRSVSNPLDRHDELRALATADRQRLHALLRKQRRVVLATDGLQPDVGHEILWVLRDCLSGEILLARSLLSTTVKDLKALLTEARQALPVPIVAAVSVGQDSPRKAIALALPGVPHQQSHFHYLREAARPIYEADRHAKKELEKRVRGVRPIEREVEQEGGEGAAVLRGYRAAVRAALTDDGRPPLCASGLKLHERLSGIVASQGRVAARAGCLPGGLESRIPRTNNDLEHLFGSHRYHERRASGRKRASPGLVVQGSVRVVASLATRLRPEEGLNLRAGYVEGWRRLRAELDKRRECRRNQRRFRRNPDSYLSNLEERSLKLSLPS
ncbi:MAG: ISNCY family transposase [Gemmataceae bacterium]